MTTSNTNRLDDAHARRAALSGRRIFVAAPMSGFSTDAEYELHRGVVNEICDRLEACGAEEAYFAGRNIVSSAHFTEADDAFRADFAALQRCDLFVLYYPGPIRSSVLVEAGMAIGMRKPSLLMAPRAEDLVYLLRNASNLSGHGNIPPITVREWGAGKPAPAKLVSEISRALQALEVADIAP